MRTRRRTIVGLHSILGHSLEMPSFLVRKNPAPWLWMYKHWRYRPLAANPAAYPFYANVSEDFERRLDEGARKLPPMTSKVKLPKAAGKVRSKKFAK